MHSGRCACPSIHSMRKLVATSKHVAACYLNLIVHPALPTTDVGAV
jgi:hypothetical protein